MSKLNVYGGYLMVRQTRGDDKQRRVIVAAVSQKSAARLFDISAYQVRNYMAVTGNKKENDIARSRPGVVFYRRRIGNECVYKRVKSNSEMNAVGNNLLQEWVAGLDRELLNSVGLTVWQLREHYDDHNFYELDYHIGKTPEQVIDGMQFDGSEFDYLFD